MNILVCIKQVPNTAQVRIHPVTNTLIREGVPSIMNPDDKAGLETALALKDEHGATITVLSMGPQQAQDILREALAMGADNAVLLTDKAFAGADTLATSYTLAAAIKQFLFDLVITGRQAIDGDTAQVGPQIAEHLSIPNISYVQSLCYSGNTLTATSQFDDQKIVYKTELPCLITAVSEATKARYATPGAIFKAYQMPILHLSLQDLQLDTKKIGLKGSPTQVVKTYVKPTKTDGVVVEAAGQEAADLICQKLQDSFVLQ